jgi:hypothetical protein
MTYLRIASFAALTLVLSSATASAAEGEIAGIVGGGLASGVGSGDPYGLGIGLRGGVSIHGVYVGPRVGYWTGTGEGRNAGQAGGEIGYGLRFFEDRLLIRPVFGVGIIGYGGSESAALSVGGVAPPNPRIELSSEAPYLQPTVLVTFAPQPGWFIGAEAGALLALGVQRVDGTTKTVPAGIASLQLGVRF